MIAFACISPHPPILLPEVGLPEDRKKVKKTIDCLDILAEKFKNAASDIVVISSPHPDWGFNVPLHFLTQNFRGKIEKVLIGVESPKDYFKKGAEFYKSEIRNHKYGTNPKSKIQNSKFALIASGDLSHCLKADGPYGFHCDGPKFDEDLIRGLERKDVETILKLDELYPEAGECGLRSFCFMFGILEASGLNYRPEILSYEWSFGVGYLVADFKLSF